MCFFQEGKPGEGEAKTGELSRMPVESGEIPVERLFATGEKCVKLALDCSNVRKNLQNAGECSRILREK